MPQPSVYEAKYNGRRHVIAVTPLGANAYEVRVGEGAPIRATADRLPGGRMLLRLGARVLEVPFLIREAAVSVWIGNVEHALTIEDRMRKQLASALGGGAPDRDLTASMPGKILKTFVRVGEAVKPGDALFIMEAMKMENEIKSGVAGKVVRLHVEEGQTVETGAKLIEIGD